MENKVKPNLILDIDETILHSKFDNNCIFITYRPGLFQFLENVSLSYNIYIYTAGTETYAKCVVDDIKKYYKDIKFNNVLSRNHLLKENKYGDVYYTKCLYHFYKTIYSNSEMLEEVKDRIIREKVKKTIIIDNISYNFYKQPNNGINIVDFYDDPYDRALYKLMRFLNEYTISELDVDEYLPKNLNKLEGIIKQDYYMFYCNIPYDYIEIEIREDEFTNEDLDFWDISDDEEEPIINIDIKEIGININTNDDKLYMDNNKLVNNEISGII